MSRRAVAAIAGAVVAAATLATPATVASAQSAGSELADVAVERYGGADRYETSLLIAEAFTEGAGGTVTDVVMVSGLHWTDAVVAAAFASPLGAPVLMTPPGELRDDALAFLKRAGVERVSVVAAGVWPDTNVSPRVFDQLRAAGLSVYLNDEGDHYGVGVWIARWLEASGSLSRTGRSAIIANGEVFADALVAGPMSYRAEVPVLLTPRDELHSGVAEYLRDADIAHVVLMGGTAALSDDVETAIRDLGITNIDRMAGATRFETATMTARYAADVFADDTDVAGCFGGSSVGLARARIPFDSLGAAPLLAQRCAPLVLTDPAEVPRSTAEFLDTVRLNADQDVGLTVFGGDAAVSQVALDTYLGVAGAEEAERGTEDDEASPNLDELLTNAAAQRSRIVKELTAKINEGSYGVDDHNVLRGPSDFRVNLGECPQNWSDNSGVTDSEIRLGYSGPQTGVFSGWAAVGQGMNNYFAWVNENDPVAGRHIALISRDDAYSPARTIGIVGDLIENENVLSVTTLGSPQTLAVYDRLNDGCVPQPFVVTAHAAWGDPVLHPWTTGILTSFLTEAHLWGTWIEQNLSEMLPVSVAAVVMDNDFGIAYESGFKAWADAHPEVVSRFTPVRHSPNIQALAEEMEEVAGADPDVYISMTADSFCRLAMQEADSNGLAASVRSKGGALFTSSVCGGVEQLLKPVGDAANGWWIIDGGAKNIAVPGYAEDPFVAFANDQLSAAGIDPDSPSYDLHGIGYLVGYPMVEALRIAADLPGGLTRTNFLLAVRSLDISHPLVLDGVRFHLDGAADGYAIEGSGYLQYDSQDEGWDLGGPVVDIDGETPNCSWVRELGRCGTLTLDRSTSAETSGPAGEGSWWSTERRVLRNDRPALQGTLKPGYWMVTADSFCLYYDSEADEFRQGSELGEGHLIVDGIDVQFDQSTRIRLEHRQRITLQTFSGDDFGASTCRIEWVSALD